ncbi:MAG: hypothetical protein K9M99_00960 [Candidatus Cloacimonetes bacterium]|nr:hypothetical protein [Candidatus Cloacimonadota bacterium]
MKHSEDYYYNYTQQLSSVIFGLDISTAIEIDQNIVYVASILGDSRHIIKSFDDYVNFEVPEYIQLE